MTIAISALIFSLLMIFLSKIPVAYAMNQQPGGYDNRYPRHQQSQLSGFGQRALAAHQNSLEAFPMFAAALSVALWSGAEAHTVNSFSLVFVLARVFYTLSYWANIHLLRSVSWSVGFVSCLALMIIALP